MKYELFTQERWNSLQLIVENELINNFKGCTIDQLSRQMYVNLIRFFHDEDDLVAKIFFMHDTDSEWNRFMKEGFESEVIVYKGVPEWWHVRMVKTIIVPDNVYIVVMTNFKGSANWTKYIPCPVLDDAIALQFWSQLLVLKDMGVQHNDLKFRNIMFNEASNLVTIIDFEQMKQVPTIDAHASNVAILVSTLGSIENTKGIATSLIKLCLCQS